MANSISKVVSIDTETTHFKPAWGNVNQAAIQPLDLNLDPLGPASAINARPDIFTIPTPGALITQRRSWPSIFAGGVSQLTQAKWLADIVATNNKTGPTLYLAQNGHAFDWPHVVNSFYRAPMPLYPFQTNGNVVGDTLTLFRMAHLVEPGAIAIPAGQRNALSFSQLPLAMANGLLPVNVHSAAGDVATLAELLRIVKQKAPLSLGLFLERADRAFVSRLLDDAEDFVFYIRGNNSRGLDLRRVVPIGTNPVNRNEILCVDLRTVDIEMLPALSSNDLAEAIRQQPGMIERIRINRVPPVLSPDTEAGRRAHATVCWPDDLYIAKVIRRDRDFRHRFIAASVAAAPAWPVREWVEEQAYGKFVNPRDAELLAAINATGDPAHKRRLAELLQDPRMREMIMRRFFDEVPDALTAAELTAWREWRHQRLYTTADVPWPTVPGGLREIEELLPNADPEQAAILVDYRNILNSGI